MSFIEYVKEKLGKKIRKETSTHSPSFGVLFIIGCILVIVGGAIGTYGSLASIFTLQMIGLTMAVTGAMEVVLVITLYADYLEWKEKKNNCPSYVS